MTPCKNLFLLLLYPNCYHIKRQLHLSALQTESPLKTGSGGNANALLETNCFESSLKAVCLYKTMSHVFLHY